MCQLELFVSFDLPQTDGASGNKLGIKKTIKNRWQISLLTETLVSFNFYLIRFILVHISSSDSVQCFTNFYNFLEFFCNIFLQFFTISLQSDLNELFRHFYFLHLWERLTLYGSALLSLHPPQPLSQDQVSRVLKLIKCLELH